MGIIKKIIASAMLALAMLGLSTSLPAFADGASDAAMYCVGCHNGLSVSGVAVGAGAMICSQRTVTEWEATINRMNGKGCGVPTDLIPGIANYLALLGVADGCNSRPSLTPTSLSFTATQDGPLPASQSLTLSILSCNLSVNWSIPTGNLTWLSVTPTGGSTPGVITITASIPSTQMAPGSYSVPIYLLYRRDGFMTLTGTLTVPVNLTINPSTDTTTTSTTTSTSSSTTVESTTTTTYQFTCYNADGSSFGANGYCPLGTSYSPPPSCPGGVLTPTLDHGWTCSTDTTTSTTTSTTVTTAATTTTTTLCNTYVNGTTQYPYSGKGSCHGHSDDGTTTGHIVRDQKWCRKHMTHFNGNGNHTHAYPHPACM